MTIILKILSVLLIIILVILLLVLILILFPFKYVFVSTYKGRELVIDLKYIIFNFNFYFKIPSSIKCKLLIFNKNLFENRKTKNDTSENEIKKAKKSKDKIAKKEHSDATVANDKNIKNNIEDSDKIIKDLFVSAKKYEKIDRTTKVENENENANAISKETKSADKVGTLLDKLKSFIPYDTLYVIRKIYEEIQLLPKKILPKKSDVKVNYGIRDPYIYGISYAILAPFIGISDEKLLLKPNFGKNGFSSELTASKRVPLVIFIKPIVKLFFDKKFMKIVLDK